MKNLSSYTLQNPFCKVYELRFLTSFEMTFEQA